MNVLWRIISRSLRDLWDESFLLIIFNVLWVLGAGMGTLLLAYGLVIPSLVLILIGFLLLLPSPMATFGLFHAAYEIGQGKAIGVRTFLSGAWRMRSKAYRWGAMNLVVILVLIANIRFYANPAAPLGDTTIGAILSSFFLSLTVFWLLWQLFALTLFPREDSLGIIGILRRAGGMILRQPVPTFFTAMLALVLGLVSFFVQILPLLITFSLITVLANRTTAEILGESAIDPPMTNR